MSGLPDDAIARAKAIAARLTASLGPEGGGGGTKRRFGEGESDVPRKREKVYIPTDNPEFNFFSLLIGPRGSTQKRLQEHTGARINIRGTGSDGGKTEETPDGGPQEEMHVLIEGTDEQVAAAKKEVEKILFDPAEAMRLKAAQLRNLAEIKGGYQPGVGLAGGAGPDGDGHYGPGRSKPGLGFGAEPETGEMKIPSSMVGLVIGRGGENIQKLTAKTGCFVQVSKETEPGDQTRVVSIKGPTKEGVAEALKMVQEQVDEAQQERSRPRPGPGGGGDGGGHYGGGGGGPPGSDYGFAATLTVQVPSEKVGLIIGRGGSTIRAIQDRTGANVTIPNAQQGEDPHMRTITISAPDMGAAEFARSEIHGLLSSGPGGPGGGGGGGPPMEHGGTALIMHIDQEKVGLIIGRSGAVIKEIQLRTGTRIQVPTTAEPGSNPPIRAVTIMGPGDGPERARYEIETKLMNEGCRDAQGNYIPYQPSPAFIVPVGPGGVPLMPGAAPPPPPPQASPYYQAPPGYPPQQPPPGYLPTGYPPQPQQPDPYAAYYQQQQQPPPPQQQQPAYPPQPNGGAGAPPPPQQQQPAAAPAPAPAPAPAQAPAPAPAPASNGAAAATAAAGGPAAGGGATYDLSQYWDQYWAYAQHYGEEYARKQYGTWAPPDGTPPPPGITLPSLAQAAAAIAALSKTA